ncbi:hypothetical protein [Limnohabitans sp. Rim8]
MITIDWMPSIDAKGAGRDHKRGTEGKGKAAEIGSGWCHAQKLHQKIIV